MKEPISVVVGKLSDPTEVIKEDGSTVILPEWNKRAMWSYLRLIHGRSIDDKIKAELRKGEDMQEVFISFVEGEYKDVEPRTLQFIVSSSEVLAVATMKHLLIPPAQVYKTAAQILGSSLSSSKGLYGQFLLEDGFAGIKTGYQIDAGDLTTRTAIRVGVFARVEMCFNPLSWLGVSGLSRFAVPSDYERILRIKKLNELFPRLQAAITNAKAHLGDLEKRVEHTKGVSLSSKTATRLNGSMCMAYGLGEKTIKEVMERYAQAEDKTQYGLAMAQSWQAQHGEHRKTPEGRINRVPQSLSTISGATLLIDDIKKAEAKIRKWLGDQKSDLAAELLKGKLP
jgi:hypothetical protein